MKTLVVVLRVDELRDVLHRKVVLARSDDQEFEIQVEMDWRDTLKASQLLDGGEGAL